MIRFMSMLLVIPFLISSACSKTADCRDETILVKVHCGAALEGAKVQVHLTSPEGRTSDVLSLGPCPADQNAEFALSNYKDLKTVSVFAKVIKENQIIKEFSIATVDVAPSCSAIDIDLDVGGNSSGKDAEGTMSPDQPGTKDGGADGPPACAVGTEGCSCFANSKCEGEFVCTLGQCRTGMCGDGKINSNEECDDGNAVDTDACRNRCKDATCGDGVKQDSKEECDDGATDNSGPCLKSCKKATCGDSFIQKGVETCDDGNAVDTDACSNLCKSASCGDGKVQAGEACDDGNPSNSDECLSDCKLAKCGDGFTRSGVEVCDDGNANNTDSCTTTCKSPGCGDGFLQSGEQCDDGNAVNTDSCTSSCRNAQCGDGFVQAGEGCDDGAAPKVELDACAPDCSWRYEKRYIYPSTSFFGGSATAGTYTGNLGGPAGADAICQGLAGSLRPLSKWKAMIVGGSRTAAATPYNSNMAQDWVIRKYTYYYNEKNQLVWRTDGTRLLGVRNGAPQNLLAEVINTYPWGGWLDDWTTQPEMDSQGTCKGWTSSNGSDWGTFPLTSLLKGAGEPCYTNLPLLCVEQ